jgi:hypothetical protein
LNEAELKGVQGSIALAVLLQILCLPLFYVGYFTDDALFICLAKGLLRGTYATIFSPVPTPLTDPLPGFPALLTPAVAFFGPWIEGSRIVPLVSTWAAGFLLAGLLKPWMGRFWVYACLLLFLFNATIVRYAGAVMAEPSSMVFGLLGVGLLSRGSLKDAAGAGIAVGLALLLRPQYALLAAVCAVYGLLRRRPQAFAAFTASFLLTALPILLRNHAIQGEWSGYLTNLFHEQHAPSAGSYLVRLKAVLGFLFPGLFLELPEIGLSLLRRVTAWASIAGCLAVIGYSIVVHWKKPAVAVSGLYVLISAAALPFWFALEPRYLSILIPFIVLAVGVPLALFALKHPSVSKGVFVLLVFFHMAPNAGNVRQAWAAQNPSRKPARTFAWIRGQTPPEARFLSDKAPALYVHTGRRGYVIPFFQSEDRLSDWIKDQNVQYVLFTEGGVAGNQGRPGQARRSLRAWLSRHPEFQLVFEDAGDHIQIFHRSQVSRSQGITS